MNKYEKMMKDDLDKKDKVAAILKLLDGDTFDDIKDILDAAKFFCNGCATFDGNKAEDWIENL